MSEKYKNTATETDRRQFIKTIGWITGGTAIAALPFGKSIYDWIAKRRESDDQSKHIKKYEKFDIESYTPPKEGQILKSKIIGTNAKNILYLVDQHNFSGTIPLESDPITLQTQRESYVICENLINRFGHLPCVIDGWDSSVTRENMKRLSEEDSGDGYHLLGTMAREKDQNRRVQMAREVIGKYSIPFSIILYLVYPDLVHPQGIPPDMNYLEELNTVTTMAGSPDSFLCADDPAEKNPLTLSDAMEEFQQTKGKKPEKIQDCYCRFRELFNSVLKGFYQLQHVDTAREEVYNAYNSPGNLILINAGIYHLPQELSEMDKLPVNYHIIAPQAIEGDTVEVMEKGRPIPPNLPDDDGKSCEQWRAKQDSIVNKKQTLMQEQLIKFLNDDESDK